MATSGTYDAQQLLTTAITMEGESAANYLRAAKQVSSESVRSVFETLAKQEKAHQTYLTQVLESFKKARRGALGWPEIAEAPQELLDTARANLFPEAKDPDPTTYVNAVDAIRRGIQMEVDSIVLYRNLAGMAKDQSAKNMFNTLVMWEEDHLFILNYWLGLQGR